MKSHDLRNFDFSKISSSHASAGLLWLSTISQKEKWCLAPKQQCEILGKLDFDIYQNWIGLALNGSPVEMDEERLICLSLLLKIHKLLDSLCPTNTDSSILFKNLNSGDFLNGASIREYLLRDSSLDRYFELTDYLEQISSGSYP